MTATRRNFLSVATALAIVPAVPAIAAAATVPADNAADAELIALAERTIELCRAHDAAITAAVPYEEKYFEWRKKNPVPTKDAGLATKWLRRSRDARRRTGYRAAEIARENACDASADAINTLIATRPRTFAGLAIKAKTMKTVDDEDLFDWRFADEILAMAVQS